MSKKSLFNGGSSIQFPQLNRKLERASGLLFGGHARVKIPVESIVFRMQGRFFSGDCCPVHALIILVLPGACHFSVGILVYPKEVCPKRKTGSKLSLESRLDHGGPEGIRTPDPQIRSLAQTFPWVSASVQGVVFYGNPYSASVRRWMPLAAP
jgi:hypothetical protein